MNLVLDDVQEAVRGKFAEMLPLLCPHSALVVLLVDGEMVTNLSTPTDEEGNETTRPLGLVVARGTLLVVISPVDGSEVIANPFAQQEEEA